MAAVSLIQFIASLYPVQWLDYSDLDSDSTLFNQGGPTLTQGCSSLGLWVQSCIMHALGGGGWGVGGKNV